MNLICVPQATNFFENMILLLQTIILGILQRKSTLEPKNIADTKIEIVKCRPSQVI